jgi:hypothetical protein
MDTLADTNEYIEKRRASRVWLCKHKRAIFSRSSELLYYS